MGGTQSKASESGEPSEIERNRRLREFEEEWVERGESAPSTPPVREHYFSQFMKDEEDLPDNLEKRRKESVISSILSVSQILTDDEDCSSGGGSNNDKKKDKVDDKEVEDAIAELEETFRIMSPKSKRKSEKDQGEGRTDRSSSFSLPKESIRSNPVPVIISSGNEEEEAMMSRMRRGTPMIPGPSQLPPGPGRHRRPVGHSQLSRSSTGLLSGTSNGVGGTLDLKGAALSAPAGVSSREPNQWEPPQIQGFDVEKFREANRPRALSTSAGLPTPQTRDSEGQPQKAKSKSLMEKPSYTKDELELLNKLEREV